MAMVCPECHSVYENQVRCPRCEVPLSYQATAAGPGSSAGDRQNSWQQTPWGRLLVGLLLAQGLYYALRHLSAAGLLAASIEGTGVWETLSGLILLQGVQALAVLAAGILVGAGQSRGFLYGSVVGIWSSVAFIVFPYWTGETVSPVVLFVEPILQVAFGALGGFVGSRIWPPLPSLALSTFNLPYVPLVAPRGFSALSGPVAWGRVLMGISIVVGGVVWADVIRDFVLTASEGALKINTHLQADLVTWEISALAALAGGVVAGASTRNGLKQGLCVGFAAALIIAVIHTASKVVSPNLFVLVLTSGLPLAIGGGWFGSQLLPPVTAPIRRKRVGPEVYD